MKYYDKIGFSIMEEKDPIDHPGVWTPNIKEEYYRGDILNLSSRWETSQQLNDNIKIDHKVSIICDGFIENHFSDIKYLWFSGARWKVVNVEITKPRLVLTTGGLYNDKKS